ncbi:MULTISPECIES: GNAT family N-acetyltransferase [unclassified Fusibacter]|uniref:GNAT family N-acetyltransferase n=1 Tax=unclassified Fusibacter TaxID=2624464 RepID=UPI0010121251|nr:MULTISPECIES: GNAT family N-acetyltransferase [unclassified Fusibacter]MCK8058988.1 GNAT family N-acetyltransferase [Fusibacter sp. A2]NPE22399.1 GNAT family N-acetyltransferase [Fusibacter sp. A1]RXV60506.1 GNAT family N-acetyltransferase [Fusibacter sp. A1]
MKTYKIRPVKPGDGSGINELRRMPGVFENILGIPSERSKRNEDFILNMGANTHMFVAVMAVEGQDIIVGTAGLNVMDNPRLRHSGSIGIMVHKEYQGIGIGQALMETLLDVADNWLMLVRVELTVFSDNERAVKLYTKLGFETEGLKKKAAIRNGQYADEYMMSRIRNI